MRQNDGSSYERQIRMAREIAVKYDLELVNDYQDLGVSAFNEPNALRGTSVPLFNLIALESL
ncbi:hypothetical protein ACOXPK_000659 [Escherichia coli O84:H51]|nr:hypothetical protein [Escherichia coli]